MTEINVEAKSNEGDESSQAKSDEQIELRTIWKTMEEWAWIALVAMPVMYWISGEAVSQDQAIIRWGMIVVTSVIVLLSCSLRIRRHFALDPPIDKTARGVEKPED